MCHQLRFSFVVFFSPHFQTAKWIQSPAVLKHALGPWFHFSCTKWLCVLYWSTSAHVYLLAHAHTHTRLALCVCVVCFFFSVHCVDTIPAFMRLPEPICVPTGAILAQMRPPLGTIWALLKAVSTPPPLSSAHCDQSYLLWRKEELWILSVSLWNSWCFRSAWWNVSSVLHMLSCFCGHSIYAFVVYFDFSQGITFLIIIFYWLTN